VTKDAKDLEKQAVLTATIERPVCDNGKLQPEISEPMNDEIYKAIIETTRDAIFAFNPDGTYRFVNPTFAKAFGSPPEQLIGKSPYDIFSPEEAERRLSLVREVFKSGQPGEIRDKVIMTSGETRFFHTCAEPLKDENGVKYVICVSKDITEEKRLETDQKEAKALLEDVVENLPLMVFLKEAQDLRFVMFNRAGEELTGYDSKFLIGMSDLDFFPPQQAAHFMEKDRAVLDGKTDILDIPEESILTANKGQRLLHTRKVCIRGADGQAKYLLGISEDITDRKKDEEKLLESAEKYQNLAEGIKDIAYSLDAEGKLEFIGKQVSGYGLRPGNMVGRSFLEFVHPDDRGQLQDEFIRSARTGEDILSTFRVIDEKGNIHWFEEAGIASHSPSGKYLGSTGILRDITDRKLAEESLNNEKNFNEAIIESLPGMLYVYDDQGRLIQCNKQHEQMTGYSWEELSQMNPLSWYDDEADKARVRATIEQIFTVGYGEVDAPMRIKNGQILQMHFTGAKLVIAGKKYFVGVGTDISRQKEHEAENRKLQEQNIQAQKMEALGLLAGGIAHDLNNILAIILGCAEMARENLDPNSSTVTELNEIDEAGQRAAKLIKGLLAFTRKQPLKVVPANINSIVKEFMGSLGRLVGPNITIHQNLANDLWTTMVDTNQIISTIVANLVTNAAHAMPNGGTLTVETRNIILDKNSLPACENARAGKFVLLSIEDTGTGISPENLPKIFQPFFTTKDVGKGTGLGLSMTLGSVIQQGGFIDVESQVNKGTKFKLYFPSTDLMTEEKQVKERKESLIKGDETILVVDDDPKVREIVVRVLQKCGYKVIRADNAGSAYLLLKKMEEEKQPIDLVLTDIKMPMVSGTELGKKIINEYPEIPVVYMSGHPDEEDQIADFLVKPFSPHTLSQKIRQILDAKKGRKQNGKS